MSPLPSRRYRSPPDFPLLRTPDLAGSYWDRVRVFALRRLRDAASAEDLAQETLRQVDRALGEGRVDNLEALPAYVFQTARHLCLQRFRSEGRESRALERLERESTGAAVEPDPLMQLVTGERRAAVRRALAQLDPGDRSLLEQLYFNDVAPIAAAAELGVTPEALRVRKHRALRRLRVLLGDLAPDVTS